MKLRPFEMWNCDLLEDLYGFILIYSQKSRKSRLGERFQMVKRQHETLTI